MVSSASRHADASDRAARGARERGGEWTAPVYVISAAAEMAGMHPQTLRQYDRLGLVVPQRQGGRQRRYSRADVERLLTVQALSREGVSLEGIRRIVALQREVEQLQDTVVELASQVDRLHQVSRLARVFTVGAAGDVSARYAERRAPGSPEATGTAVVRAGASVPGAPGARATAGRDAGPRALTAGAARPRRVLAWNPARD